MDRTRSLAALDLLRFGCAMLVVAFHYGAAFARAPSDLARVTLQGLTIPAAGLPLTWFGWIGVELFFVISGYVIAVSARGATPGGFLRRRALRLLPAAWVCASVTALALYAAGSADAATLATRWANSISFVAFAPQIDASYWTLGIEVSFYLLVAGLLRGGASDTRLATLALGLAGWSAAYWLMRTAGGGFGGKPPGLLANLSLASYGAFFALGLALQAAAAGAAGPRMRLAAALAVPAAVAEIADHVRERLTMLHTDGSVWPVLAIFVAGVAVIHAAPRLRVGARTARFATLLGLATYPLYLLHQEAGAIVLAALLGAGVPFAAGVLATASLALCAAILCTRVAEPPLRRLLARLLSAGTAARDVSVLRAVTPR